MYKTMCMVYEIINESYKYYTDVANSSKAP